MMRKFRRHDVLIPMRGWAYSPLGISKARRLVVGLLTGLSIAGPVQAQDVHSPLLDSPIPMNVNDGRMVEVLQRPRPEYAPLGIRVNTFVVTPKIMIGDAGTNNVYGAQKGLTSDVVGMVDASLAVEHAWKNGSLSVSGGGNFRRYAHQAVRNENGFFTTASGQYRVSSALAIFSQVEHRLSYLPQYMSDVPANSLSTVVVHTTTGLARAEYTGGSVKITAAADVANLVHDDVVSSTGAIQGQRYRNRLVSRLSARTEYSFRSDVAGFVEGSVQQSDFYQQVLSDGSPNRDGKEYRLIGGVVTNISPLARAWVGIGYIKLDFDSGFYRPISGFAYDSKILIVPSGLTTITLQAKRAIVNSATTGSGYFSDIFQVRVDHELLRNILLYTQGGHETNRFRGLERTDKIWRGELGSTYFINRNTIVSSAVIYVNRDSDSSQLQSYSEWRGTLAVTLAL